MKKIIAIANDHAGVELKNKIIEKFKDEYDFINCGTDDTTSVDYPDYAQKVCDLILKKEANLGILICGTGIGISITANKIKGIRAALCGDCFSAQATREHNDANIVALGARVTGPGLAIKIVDTFLDTPFSNDERHLRRIQMIED